MSSYGHEMERELSSAPSLPSRGGSEMESRYSTEAGIFMSSITFMVFISCLVIVGVSLVSLLVALAVMLQSCESKKSGVVEMYSFKSSYDYCRNFALHAELNSLGGESLPKTCRDVDRVYVEEGQYRRDLNITVAMVEDFFNGFTPLDNGSRGIAMMDADDLVYKFLWHRVNEVPSHESNRDADYLRHVFLRKLYLKLQSRIILFSRKPENLSNYMAEYLTSVGCHAWSSFIMRKESEIHVDFGEFLWRERVRLQRDGLRIAAVISSRMDALRGPCLGNRVFKIPSPMFRYKEEGGVESE